MSNRSIYDALRSAGMTAEGACGVMGNMMAESGMKPDIAQRGMTSLSDEAYTAAADSGLIDFVNDAVGYGLCQWTFHTRKAALLAFARNRGVSVGDGDMQTAFCEKELREDYPALWDKLCTSHDLLDCTQAVCRFYERPAVNNVGTRYEYAQQALAYFTAPQSADDPAPDACPIDPTPSLDIVAEFLASDACRELWSAFIAGRKG